MEIITAYKDRILGAVQSRGPLPPIQSVDEGISRIEQILQRELLCRNDIEDINDTYKNIEQLEGRVGQSCQIAQGKIVDKVTNIIIGQPIREEDVISLYFLRTALARDLRKNPSLKNALREFDKNTLRISSVDYWDCCRSMNLDEIPRFFNQKRKKILEREQKLHEVACKKRELAELRRHNPQNYPLYLDELLDKGYTRLFDQIVQMRELPSRNARREEIEKSSYSLISHGILETRDAIIKKVEASIPEGQNKIIFLIGGSGAGKSTSLCFLGKNKMVLGADFNYSTVGAEAGLIGHEGAISCTFLPTVKIVDDVVFVDFPGFEDTHGPAIAIGMRLALKALHKRYSPKVLVLESITNCEGRYAAAAQLGQRLDRLFENKGSCLLGITKYSKDPHFGRLKAIEMQQKNELLNPNVEEIGLIAQIEALNAVNSPAIVPIIEEKQRRLAEIAKEKKEKLLQPLPETEEKMECRNRIEQKEEELANQIGIVKRIRFNDLEDEKTRSTCMAILSEHQEAVCCRSVQLLDPDDEALLWNRFENNLVKEMVASRDHHSDFKEVETFEQSVLESSLINTIFGESNPEIGHFLHLPEMNPKIVRGYDRHIVSSCIKEYMKIVIEKFNASFIDTILRELGEKGSKAKVEDLKKSWGRLRDYILVLEGVIAEDPAQAEQKWTEIQKKHSESVSAKFNWEARTVITELISTLGLFYPVFLWFKKNKADLTEIDNTIVQCQTDLDKMYQTLLRLKGIEKIIEKQEEIDRAFNSVALSTESSFALRDSIQTKINNIRKVYGEEEWDKRVAFLSEKFILKNFYPTNSSHAYVFAHAYWFIESDLIPVYNPPQREKVAKEDSELCLGPLNQMWNSLAMSEISFVGMHFGKMLNLFTPQNVEEFVLALPKAEALIMEESLPLLWEGEFEELKEFAYVLSKQLSAMVETRIGGLDEVKKMEALDLTKAKDEIGQWTKTYKWLRELLDEWGGLKKSQALLKKIRVFLWALVEGQKTGLEWSDRKVFIASFRRETTIVFEVFGFGKRPKLAKDVKEFSSGNLPLARALSAAALLKWHEKLRHVADK